MLVVTECYRSWAEVDLHALRENLARIRGLAGPTTKIITVVKADAYGHGLRPIAAVLMQSGTDVFGVANLAEARAIRSVGKGWPILLLGACLPHEMELAVRDGIMPTISSLDEAAAFSQTAVRMGATAALHLKVDTGMGRLGTPPEQASELVRTIAQLPGLAVKGIYTHFAAAEDDADFTERQRNALVAVLNSVTKQGSLPEYVHASNSAGLLLEPLPPCNTVRAGLLVYGVVPPGSRLSEAGLAPSAFCPALSWKCRVGFVKEIAPGTPLSYGHTFTAPTRMRVATVTAGYGDGFLRAASNRAQVLIGGVRCPVVGRVTMDQMVVDVSKVPPVQAGDEVVLIGKQGGEEVSATELAAWCQTVPWEVLTNITYRVPRIYRGCQAS